MPLPGKPHTIGKVDRHALYQGSLDIRDASRKVAESAVPGEHYRMRKPQQRTQARHFPSLLWVVVSILTRECERV